jgi:hypothetical protein
MKQAIRIAHDYVVDLYGKNAVDVRLEEIERSEDEQYWLVTIGLREFLAQGILPAMKALHGGIEPRLFKVVAVNRSNGEVVSMKNRAA